MRMGLAREQVRPLLPLAGAMLVLLLAAAALLRHVGVSEAEELNAAIARYERIAADLPRLEAESRAHPAPPAEALRDSPSIAAAQWQSRLGRIAATHGLQLASAEPLLAEAGAKERPVIALELVGSNVALLGFLHEIERGAAMSVKRLELLPIQSDASQTDPALRLRLQTQPRSPAQ